MAVRAWMGSRGGGDADRVQVYHTTELGTHLTNGFRMLWENKQLFDCSILVDGQTFELHKGLLIALSPYFQSMFTSGFEEAGRSSVEIKALTAAGFDAIDIMETAALLQVPGVLDFCGDFITEKVTTTNCLDLFKLAHVYDHVPSLCSLSNFMAQNCLVMSEKAEFYKMPADFLAKVLASERLPFKCEMEVLTIVCMWLTHNKSSSSLQELKLLECVRFALIPTNKLRNLLNQCPPEVKFVSQFKAVMERACSFVFDPHKITNQVPAARYRQAQYAGPSLMMVHDDVDGIEEQAAGRVTLCRLQGTPATLAIETTQYTKRLPYRAVYKTAAIAQLSGFVFVSGGELEPRPFQGFNASSKVYRRDFLSQHWVEIAGLLEGRGMHGMASLGDMQLIVIGGMLKHEGVPRKLTASVEKYDMTTNSWQRAHDFPYKVCNVQACTLMGKVYTSGGSTEAQACHRLHVYNEHTDTWQEKSSMNFKKTGHIMVSCNDLLFTCGGSGGLEEALLEMANESALTRLVEYYSPVTDQWTSLTSPATVRNILNGDLCGGYAVQNCIHILGTQRVVVLNTHSGQWKVTEHDSNTVALCLEVQVPANYGAAQHCQASTSNDYNVTNSTD